MDPMALPDLLKLRYIYEGRRATADRGRVGAQAHACVSCVHFVSLLILAALPSFVRPIN